MNAIETARQRRFDAELAESLGNDVPAGLANQIEQSLLQAQHVPGAARNHRRRVWLAAACLLLGIGVVASVAKARAEQAQSPLQQTGQEPKPQDPEVPDPQASKPKLAKLTTASVYVETAELPEPGDAVARLLAVANADRGNVVLTDRVQGKSNIDLTGRNGNEAMQLIAAECNVPLSEHRGVFVLGGLGRSGQVGQRLTMQCEPISVLEFLKQVHAKTGVNFVVADNIAGLVQCDVKDAPWRSVVNGACEELDLEAVGCGTVIAIRPKQAHRELQRIKVSLQAQSVEATMALWASRTGATIVIDPQLDGLLTTSVFMVDTQGFMQAIAEGAHARLSSVDGITHFKASAPHWSTDLTMERAPIRQALELNGSAGISVPKTGATVSVYVRGASGRHMIDAILTAAGLYAVVPATVENARKK